MLRYELGDSANHLSFPYTQRNTEIKQSFVLVSLGDYLCSREYFTERDGLKEFLIIYTLKGKGWIKYGNSEADLLPGEIVIINCENYQYYKSDCDSGWHFLWIHFSSDYAGDLVDSINQSGISVLKYDAGDFNRIFQNLVNLSKYSSLHSETQISLLLHTVLSNLISRKAANFMASISSKKAELDKLAIYIKDNYYNEITVDLLSELSHISKFYLIRLFKEMTGTTPYRYILLTRVDEAKKLLLHTAKPVEEIGEQTGFCDSKNFIFNFKKITGLTPLQYRKTRII